MGARIVPPQVVHIKRKRNQDPLQALIFEESRRHKKSKNDSYVFTFARTINSHESLDKETSILRENASQSRKRKSSDLLEANKRNIKDGNKKIFYLPKQKRQEKEKVNVQIPDALNEMVQSYLQQNEMEKDGGDNNNMETKQIKTPIRHKTKHVKIIPPKEGTSDDTIKTVDINRDNISLKNDIDDISMGDDNDDYVYDVYFQDRSSEVNDWKSANIGLIKLDEDDEALLSNESDIDSVVATDDEDSNAEDFYKNDYPDEEEEDDDRSIIGSDDELFDELDSQMGKLQVADDQEDGYSSGAVASDDEDDVYVIKNDSRRFSTQDYLRNNGNLNLEEGELTSKSAYQYLYGDDYDDIDDEMHRW